MSLVGRRMFAVEPINPVAGLSKGVCVCKRVSPSLHSSRSVWLAASTDCREALSNSDPHQRKAQNPLLAGEVVIACLVYVECEGLHTSGCRRQGSDKQAVYDMCQCGGGR